MRRAEAAFAAVLAFAAGVSVGVAINHASPAPAHLIPPAGFTVTPRPAPSAADRDMRRTPIPWPSPTTQPSDVEGVIPAAPFLAVGHWLPAAATASTSPGTTPAMGARVTVTAQPAGRGSPTAAQWATLRECESSDDYGNKLNPLYRGAYQVGFREWAEYGGTGRDPADASPAEQDAVAFRLWQARGWEPWASSSKCTGLR